MIAYGLKGTWCGDSPKTSLRYLPCDTYTVGVLMHERANEPAVTSLAGAPCYESQHDQTSGTSHLWSAPSAADHFALHSTSASWLRLVNTGYPGQSPLTRPPKSVKWNHTCKADWFLTKVQRQVSAERIAFSTNGVGTTGHSFAKAENKDPNLNITHYSKLTPNGSLI